MRVIDLTQYADRYILGWDEAKQVSGQPKEDIPWLRLIPGKFGKIFPWSETTFAAYVSGVKKSKQAARLPFVTVVQGREPGCPEIIVCFSPECFDEMAEFVGARRRRRLSAEHRRKLVKAGAPHRFSGRPGQNGSSAGDGALGNVDGPLTSAGGENGPPASANSASEPWSERSPL